MYLAQDTQLGRKVALKILPAEVAAKRDRMRRFEQEAKAAAALNHPNIAHIYEIGEHSGTNFIAMEFVDGQTLRECIYAKPVGLAKLLRYLQHVAEGLAKAHAAGIVHRDLKPDNIMITRDGHAKVLDFGLAKLVEPQQTSGTGEGASDIATAILEKHSAPGMILGTAGYMSPEQAQGRTNEIDQRSDIFSFGCILFEAVTGKQAFGGKDAVDSLNKIIREPATPISELNPAAPADLQRIVRRCLAKDPDERYQTIKDVAIDLKEVRRELDLQSEMGRSTAPSGQGISGSAPGMTDPSTPPALPTPSIGQSIQPGFPHSTASAENGPGFFQRNKLALIIMVVVVALIGGIVLFSSLAALIAYRQYRRTANKAPAIESIAVLPFVNISGDPNNEYLSDGLTEDFINNLSRLPGLRVTARSTAFRFKSRDIDPQKVGKELGVAAVLTGTVQQQGDTLRIQVDLVRVADGTQLWGQRYNRRLTEVLAVQGDIVQQVIERLRPTLSGEDTRRVAKNYTDNVEAYQLYLKGRYFWLRFTPEDHKKAAEYFSQAIAVDPAFALAYAGLGDTYGASATNGWISPREGYPKGKAAVRRALEIDDTLAEAHTTAGALAMFYDLDWAAAEREYRRAIELNPNYPITYEVYGYLQLATGRLDEGIRTTRRSIEVDPLSVTLADDVANGYYLTRRYDEAINAYQKAFEMDPNHFGGHLGLAEVYEIKGMHEEAINELQKAIAIGGRTSAALAMLGHAYAASGKQDEAQEILAELDEVSKRAYVSSYDLAILYVGLGDKEKALEQLNKAYEDRAGWIIYLKVEPIFDPLRSDPRFADLVRRVGL